ncbi:hypothetical protein GCM10023189_49510 [Nibrella saemangeumensis]|uniref:T9SS type A sorting domain-containing protein n=1 Tax=Nibrella saemangeumensis TaxID=1084526 RepID=A0ABP8NKE6_9BACT
MVKLNSSGTLVWQKTLGGIQAEFATDIIATGDGGFVVTGQTDSNDGDVSGNHGGADVWVVKLNEAGNLIWQKTFGGTAYDVAHSITATMDGGFVVAGASMSTNGDVSGNRGGNDFWVFRLDHSGNLIWQRTLGGSSFDVANAVRALPNGDFVVAGGTASNNGDVTGLRADNDFWVVRLNSAGNLIWQKTLGGTGSEIAFALTPLRDGTILVGGGSSSNDGDVSGFRGGSDLWVARLSGTGTLIWQKSLGGTNAEDVRDMLETPTGYLLAGFSNSTNGDISSSRGGGDIWVVHLTEGTPPLQLLAPMYDCQSGTITFRTTGGDGSPVEYQAPGITSWTTNPYQVLDYEVRKDPNSRTVTLMARQNGRVITRTFDFRGFCTGTNQAPTYFGPLPDQRGIVGQVFSYQIPAGTFSDPEGQSLRYFATGLPAGLNLNLVTGLISGTPFFAGANTATIYVIDVAGGVISAPMLFAITTPGNPNALQLIEPIYNCQTGQITFRTTGGDGSPIEYQAPGVTSWSTSPHHTVDAEVRQDANSFLLTLMARQNGITVTRTFNFRAYCGGSATRLGAEPATGGLQVRVLGNPVQGPAVEVEITGVTGQAVQLQVSDTRGRMVGSQRIERAAAVERRSVSINSSPAEILLLQVRTGSQAKTVKIIKAQ